MPLIVMAGEEAVETRKTNLFSQWGNRNEINRVEPITAPDFQVPFHIEPGEKIFTIGSCFARNVEKELLDRDFMVPVRDLFKLPELAGIDLSAINNYGTPSIYNELAWAFGVEPFDDEKCFAEVSPGKFVDLHLSPALRPEPLESVKARRNAIISANRQLADCSVLIITLGLVEIWYDVLNKIYLNVSPRPSHLRAQPGRFELHVLTYEEALSYLTRALDIAFDAAGKDLNVILTVSPVPLMATHRPADVISANCYSKSTLRTVAETVTQRYERVCYYPSYESVIYSDRKLAWEPDLIHVSPEIVRFNVGRMVAAFTSATVAGEISTEEQAIEAAKAARAHSDLGFFEEHGDWSQRSAGFAAEHAGLLGLVDADAALAILASAPKGNHSLAIQQAKILVSLDRANEAVAVLEDACTLGEKSREAWPALVDVYIAAGDAEGAIKAGLRWADAMPLRTAGALTRIGRGLRKLGEIEKARRYLEEATTHRGGDDPNLIIELAKTLITLGDREAAGRIIASLEPRTDQQALRLERIRAQLERRPVGS